MKLTSGTMQLLVSSKHSFMPIACILQVFRSVYLFKLDELFDHCNPRRLWLINSYHVQEVKHIEIINSIITRLPPSKKNSPVLVHLGEGEDRTWRRSLSYHFRNAPDS